MIQRVATRGDTIVLDFQVLEPARVPGVAIIPMTAATAADQGIEGLIPTNVTGWFFWATFKYYYPDPDTIAIAQADSTPQSKPVGGGVALVTATTGECEVTIPPAATQPFPDSPVTIVYDIRAKTTDTPAREFVIESGQYTINPSVTRAS